MSSIRRSFHSALLISLGFLSILFLTPSPCVAQATVATPAGNSTAKEAQQTPEGKFIQDLGNKAIGITVDKNLTSAQIDTKYNELLTGAFDMPMIGEFVIGRVWLRITPEQKQQYMKLFQELVLKTYGSRLHFYNGEGFQVVNVRVQSAKDTVVNSDITHSDGKTPTPVNWIVRHENGGKLAIIDVSVDGVSQSVTQRDEFASILSQNGEDFNALLKALSQKVQQQSADLPSQGQ